MHSERAGQTGEVWASQQVREMQQMESKRTKVERWHVRCAQSHAECITYEITGDGYGDFGSNKEE